MVDANGTRHHLLLGADDWARCTFSDTTFDPERAEVTLHARLFEFVAAPRDEAPDLSSRRGAGRDRYGNWYWIAPSRTEILVNSSGSGRTSHFWSSVDEAPPEQLREPGDFQPVPSRPAASLILSGVAITDDHYLLVGVVTPPGLLVFDLFATGGPRQIGWPAEIPFAPFDMAPRPGGGVWILDRANRRYWGLDRRLNIIPPYTQGIALTAATDPIAIDAVPDGSVIVLDGKQVLRYRLDRQIGDPVTTDSIQQLVEANTEPAPRLVGFDFALEPRSGRLYVVSSSGNQAFAFHADFATDQLVLVPQAQYLPMRLFGGKGIEVADGQPYYDFADRWIPLIEQRRPRFAFEGIVDTPIFDGFDPDCVWHRLMLDGCIPDQTEVLVSSRAANDAADVALIDWQTEPRPYLRGDGSELPFVAEPRGNRVGTWELLFQHAGGRYAQVRLKFRGDGRSTPSFRALRAYYPRFSYLEHYLPAVYREDASSASFLDRFLSNPEGFYTALEDKIAAVETLFDVRSAPPEVLDWLAAWLGVVHDPAWDERRQRLFIEHAVEFFQYRGTARGILMALQLVMGNWTDDAVFSDAVFRCELATKIRIIERFRTRHASAVALGDPTGVDSASSAVSLDGEGLQQAWRDFLARRYRRVSSLNRAYSGSWQTFEEITLPDPTILTGVAATDWSQFQSIVVSMRNAAHRFSVIMPITSASLGSSDEHNRLRDLAARVVELEKPAHTVFDIKFYWALFRVGGVRLGIDTVLDLGSRAPQLLPPLVLKGGYLSEGYLAPAFPQDVSDRTILGRDALKRSGGC
jgi:phage tail-like protein